MPIWFARPSISSPHLSSSGGAGKACLLEHVFSSFHDLLFRHSIDFTIASLELIATSPIDYDYAYDCDYDYDYDYAYDYDYGYD